MASKKRLKIYESRKKKKPVYKVINWTEYNQSLRKRGMISLYFPKGDIRSQFINDNPYVKGESGQSPTYQAAYIELIYILYRLFGFGQRQMTGYFEDLWKSKGLDISVPSFGHLSDSFSGIRIEIKQFCDQICRRIRNGESIDLIVDSTGLKFGNASDWYETKYNKPCERKPWKKLHIAIDLDMNMHASHITDCNQSDIETLDKLMPTEVNINALYGDGGYYSVEIVEALSKAGIIPVIPPPAHAVIRGDDSSTWHDKIVGYIKEKGSIYAFYKKYDYFKRSLVEAQNSRIKRCIGFSLLTRRDESQIQEGKIIANIINLWNSFGMCKTVKIR